MKKTAYIFISLFLGASLSAQTIDDAFNFAENDYYGTARSMALGNAMTALGSDLGSVTINPAGSAVAKYSQAAVSPGFSISSSSANVDDLTSSGKINKTRFVLPNIGFNFHFNTGNLKGIKGVSLGFVVNTVNNFNNSMLCGARTQTSYAGALADFATTNKYTQADLDADYGNADWVAALGNKTGVIDLPGKDMPWLGVTEDYTDQGILSNPVNMEYTQTTRGAKVDYILNLGFNISDIIFVGANMAIQSYNYSIEKSLFEEAVPGISYQTRFIDLRHDYTYSASGTGIYGKFGIIAAPVAGLRLGAALTTPTAMNIKEYWGNSMTVVRYVDDSKDMTRTDRGSTPESNNRYKVTAPWRFNAGLAYTFEHVILSADYELVDYGQTRFRPVYSDDKYYFEDLNKQIRGSIHDEGCEFLGKSHLLRAGIEVKPVEEIAVRAGYNLTTSGFCYYENGLAQKIKADTHAFSFGAGYDSPGSFYADVACRLKFRPAETLKLYNDYLSTTENIGSGTQTVYYDSPFATSKQLLATIVLTVGWRF